MKLSDKELAELLKDSQEPLPNSGEWWAVGIILLISVLAFLYENAGK